MTEIFVHSEEFPPPDWESAEQLRLTYGPKGATLAVLPREWTPPFALVSSDIVSGDGRAIVALGRDCLEKIYRLAQITGKLIVRSSVVGETIWDRGRYHSIIIEAGDGEFENKLVEAVDRVLASAPGKRVGLVLQSYVDSALRGEFGNLLRVSKTRDHWELNYSGSASISSVRINTQRDEAAAAHLPLSIRSGQSRERQFGSVAAWINSYLLRGRGVRVNCEWVTDGRRLYIVELDREDEDVTGINPFQLTVEPVHPTRAAEGKYLVHAAEGALDTWDKLRVLKELWEPEATHKPTLFYVELTKLPRTGDPATALLKADFEELIGPDSIVVRTSGRAGVEKQPNLRRTEGVKPDVAADWCLQVRDELASQGEAIEDYAFVAHRFLSARASAWVRAAPDKAVVEIHSLWGLPDALQFCPYDIWEVHAPTELATEYPDYKPHMLIAQPDGAWAYVRTKNELARNLSIGRREALELARRTLGIAERLGKACHVMWFIGCIDDRGEHFNVPWYWTEAHDPERNVDRSAYKRIRVAEKADLDALRSTKIESHKYAIELAPTTQTLMRCTKFIAEVGMAAKRLGLPVILAGSTLAHAYFVLRREGCTVVTPGEKERSRVRRNATFGKLVRDKIPDRIERRSEAGLTRQVPTSLRKNFLTSKLLEEALEARHAVTPEEKVVELADLFEVLRAMARADGLQMKEVVDAADRKRDKSGGFDDGLVLIQTGILGKDRQGIPDASGGQFTQVLGRRLSGTAYEIPFTFFGFMELGQPRSLVFSELGIRLDFTLRSDRIEVHASREAEQLELPLDLVVDQEQS